jgi:RNA polymerase sigma-70 factor (ECF subfamily)
MDKQRPPRPKPSALESTLELVAKVKEGDRDALERLFARHLTPLRRWASGRLPRHARSLADTDDLVQDTLLRTFKRVDGFQASRPGDLHAYLRQAVMNRLRDELRRKGREPDMTDAADLELAGSHSPLEEAIGQEALARYEQALERLDPDDRNLVIGRVEMDYAYDELAELFDRPTADAARKATQRALVRLAEEMKRGRR